MTPTSTTPTSATPDAATSADQPAASPVDGYPLEEPSFDPELIRPGESRVLDFLLTNFVRTNPLFLFSAGALLLGAWLLNPPGGDGSRSLPLLLQLFVVVQVYEFALLGAATLLAKRGGLQDVRKLLLVMGPFLLDVTFTSSGLCSLLQQQEGFLPALTLVGINILAAWFKLQVGLRLAGERLPTRALASLALGPLLVGLTPLIGLGLASKGLAPLTSLVSGGGLALLVACLAGSAQNQTLRRLAPLALAGVTVHALATSWVYESPLTWTLAPSLLVLGVVAPRFFPALAPYRRSLALALPALAVVLGEEWTGVSASQWRPILAGAALVQCVALRRDPSELAHWLGLVLVLDLALGGGTAADSWQSFGSTPFEPIVLLIASAVTLIRGSSPTLTLALAGIGLVLGCGQIDLPLHQEAALALQLFGLQAFFAGRRLEAHAGSSPLARHLRLAGALACGLTPALTLLWVPGDEVLSWASRGTGLVLVLAAWRLRSSLLAGAALPALGEACGRLAPETAAGWGVASLSLAFGLIAAGIVVSLKRERLLDWVRRRANARRIYRPETLGVVIGIAVLACMLPGAFLEDETRWSKGKAHVSTKHFKK